MTYIGYCEQGIERSCVLTKQEKKKLILLNYLFMLFVLDPLICKIVLKWLSIFDQVKYMTIYNFYEEKRRRREGLECEKKCKN